MAAKYDRIASELRGRIADGIYKPGAQLPTEPELAERHAVSIATIRRALSDLESEGIIERRHGTGTFVREQRPRLWRSSDRYQWEKDRVRLPEAERSQSGATEYDSGATKSDLAFEAEYSEVAAPAELAEAFGLPAGAPLLRRVYRTRDRNERYPLGITVSYLPYALAAGNPQLLDQACEPWPGATQHQLSTVDVELDRIVDNVTARPATEDEAAVLGIRVGAPVAAVRKISIDTTDAVVEIADIVWPGDRVTMHYVTKLERWAR